MLGQEIQRSGRTILAASLENGFSRRFLISAVKQQDRPDPFSRIFLFLNRFQVALLSGSARVAYPTRGGQRWLCFRHLSSVFAPIALPGRSMPFHTFSILFMIWTWFIFVLSECSRDALITRLLPPVLPRLRLRVELHSLVRIGQLAHRYRSCAHLDET